jgi:hypothetical protein
LAPKYEAQTTVTKREELEAALVQADAALAKAAVALVNTVTDASKIDANRAEASANLDKARANCVRVRAALREFNHSNPIVTSHERGYIQVGESEDVPKPSVIASPPSIQSRDHALRGERKRSQDESRKRKPVHRFKISFSGQEPSPEDALARSTLIRQTIDLLALILTYLLYFHADVQLQILMLPSIFP